MLLVDDHQPQPRHRGEDRQPRAQHQVGAPQVRQQPVAQPLRRRQATVQADHQVARKAFGEARFELWREVDFGHQHQRLPALLQRRLGGPQVDLGLAAAGDAVQQHRLVGRADRRQGCRLFCVEFGSLGWGGQRGGVCSCGPLLQPRHAPRQGRIVDLAQVGWQHGQRQFAHTALVIGCGKVDQLAPFVGQRWQRRQHGCQRAQFGRCGSGVGRPLPHDAGHVAAAQWHAHQGPWWQCLLTCIVQKTTHRRVPGCLDRHREQHGLSHAPAL